MALESMQKAHLDSAARDVHGKISKQTVELDTVTVTRVRFDVGARWATDLKAYAGTESCLLPHVAYVLSGRIMIRMDDGSEELFGAGDVMMLPPGHDAWTVGDEPCEFIELARLRLNEFSGVVAALNCNQNNDIQIRPDVNGSDGYSAPGSSALRRKAGSTPRPTWSPTRTF